MNIQALTQTAAAALLSTTARSLRTWEADGEGVPRNADGSYPGPALVAWFAARRAGGALDANAERARRDKETADKLAMENALRRGELADVNDVRREWSEMVLAFRSKMLSLPTKLAPQLVNVADASIIAASLRTEVHAALLELADGEAGRGSDSEPAAGPKAKPRAERRRNGGNG